MRLVHRVENNVRRMSQTQHSVAATIVNNGTFERNDPGAFGALGALLIYITLSCEGRLIHRVLASFPLRALGIVSFGLYLVHMVVLDKLKDSGIAPGSELFLLTLAIAYALACVLYGFVERPFIRMGTAGR